MSEQIIGVLLGAGIALGSFIIGAVLQHMLSLRADNIKRRRADA